MSLSPNPTPASGQLQVVQGPRAQHAKTRRQLNSSDSRAGKRNAAQQYLAKLAESARRPQRCALAEMAKVWKRHPVKDASRLAWHRVTADDIARIREALAAKFAPSTANRMLTALRRVLRFAWRGGSLAYEDFLRLSDVEMIKGESLPRGRSLTQVDLEKIYGVCDRDPSPAGRRDGLAIALMHAAGLRSAEAAWLKLEDVMDEDAGELLVPGKGGSLGGASMGEAAGWLTAWLAVRGREPGPLLYQVRSNGKVARVGLCAAAMWQIVKKRSGEAGIRKCSPHDLRRTHATALLRAGFDHLMVMRSLRHRDIRSVQCYDRRSDEERAAAQRRAIRAPGPGR